MNMNDICVLKTVLFKYWRKLTISEKVKPKQCTFKPEYNRVLGSPMNFWENSSQKRNIFHKYSERSYQKWSDWKIV